MAGGGNGQARESAELQKSQNSQSERYGIAGDMFSSKEFLSALRTKDSAGNNNSCVCRSFGNSVSRLEESNAQMRAEIKTLKAEQAKAEQTKNSGFGGLFGPARKGSGPFGWF
jgi:hypothetical protein